MNVVCVSILSAMNKHHGNRPLLYHWVSDEVYELPPNRIYTDDIAKNINVSNDTIESAAKHLKSLGYLEDFEFCYRVLGYQLTYKGTHWFRNLVSEGIKWLPDAIVQVIAALIGKFV